MLRDRFQAVRDLQARNLVVPVVGDFSGPTALAAVGAFLREHGLTVAVFYTSNVEMYLFRSDRWKTFYRNLSSMPTDGRSALVRSVFQGFGPGSPGGGFANPGSGFGSAGTWTGAPGTGVPGALRVDPIGSLLADVERGAITGYGDLLARMK